MIFVLTIVLLCNRLKKKYKIIGIESLCMFWGKLAILDMIVARE